MDPADNKNREIQDSCRKKDLTPSRNTEQQVARPSEKMNN